MVVLVHVRFNGGSVGAVGCCVCPGRGRNSKFGGKGEILAGRNRHNGEILAGSPPAPARSALSTCKSHKSNKHEPPEPCHEHPY